MWVWVDDETGEIADRRRRRTKPVPPRIDGETAYVELTQGMFAAIDIDDIALVAEHLWQVVRIPKRNVIYASTLIGGTHKRMHHFIKPKKEGFFVDHEDGDGLNNRRKNLRYCSNAQNVANRKLARVNSTGFRGVTLERRYDPPRWKAAINVAKGERRHLGVFFSPENAARAYDAEARTVFGPFACLNFPEAGERGCR